MQHAQYSYQSQSQQHAPVRPARSTRRAQQDPAASHHNNNANYAQDARQPPTTRANRLADAIRRQEGQGNGLGRADSRLSHRSSSPTGSGDELESNSNNALIDSYGMDGDDGHAPPQKQKQASPVLAKAVQAFASSSSSGAQSKQRQGQPGQARHAGSNSGTAMPDSNNAGRGRRGAVGVQGESSRMRGMNQQTNVPATPAFREMERVLAQVGEEWPELLQGTDTISTQQQENDDEEDTQNDPFDPVTLALSLVDSEADPERFRSFMATKEALSRSLKSSIQTHYRSFDASVSSYNGLQSNLSFAQKNTSRLRSTLEEVRETLGKGRSELGVLEARRTELAEMDKILNSVEVLKNVPERLENLMSEKKFLNAAGLLMKSLKTISRGDLLEINAIADLRAYFVSQESLMLEYLTEELHNHLYLKSIYTDTRWKAFAPGQSELPAFLADSAPPSIFDANGVTSSDNVTKPTRLAQFLAHLQSKSPEGPNVDDNLEETTNIHSEEHTGQMSTSASMMSITQGDGLPRSGSVTSGLGIAASGASSSALLSGNSSGMPSKPSNPEQDSFSYIESIMESLAYLGKLSVAMDSIIQRAPLEIYNLVESTVVEVDERNDPVRRSSVRLARYGVSPKLLHSGSFAGGNNNNNAAAYSLLVRSSMTSANFTMHDEASLATLHEMNTEILMDFFWSLFSKLDAVLQGFRVLHEVMSRIAARKGMKDAAIMNKSGNLMYSLNDIWKPIQIEVQALLHDYLVDDSQGSSSSSRSAVASINDTLRSGRPIRDPKKSFFKFSDTDSKSSSRRLKPFEDSLNRSLKNSVPGLVSSLAEGTPATFSTSSSSSNLLATAPSGTVGSDPNASDKRATVLGRTHRMLVPPNAFTTDALVLPTMKFLDRAKTTLPDGFVNFDSIASNLDQNGPAQGKRFSGIMDDETLERLRPALDEWARANAPTNGQASSDSGLLSPPAIAGVP